jgi:hypothetical protein
MGLNAFTFQPGHNKIGGRKKGTPNKFKLTKVRDFFIEREINPVEVIWNSLRQIQDPVVKVGLMIRLLAWVEPKLTEVTFGKIDSQGDEKPEREYTKYEMDRLCEYMQSVNPDLHCLECGADKYAGGGATCPCDTRQNGYDYEKNGQKKPRKPLP